MNSERKIAAEFRRLLLQNARMKDLPPPNIWVEEIGGECCVVRNKHAHGLCIYHPTPEVVREYTRILQGKGARKKKGYRGPGRYSGRRPQS